SCSGANFQPRERCYIEARFAPNAPGRYSANLLINTTAGQQTVSLTGIGGAASQAAVTITHFTASLTNVGAGQMVMLCYGVQNAVSARVDPDVGEIKPIEKECFSVRPSRTTNYTLTATGRDGRTVKQQQTISVGAIQPAEIGYISALPSTV